MRKLAAAAVIMLGLAAMIGAGRGGSYQGGSYAKAGATYAAGGVASDWDTVTLIMSADALVDAATDTFGLPATPDDRDRVRVRNQNDWLLGREERSWNSGSRDAAIYKRLGTGYDVPSFAFCEIDSAAAQSTDAKYISGTDNILSSPRRIVAKGVAALNLNAAFVEPLDSGTRNLGKSHFELVYIPFETLIPSNSTIVHASINFSLSSDLYSLATADTMIATLMDNTNDNKWYLAKGYGSNPNWAKTTWRRQRDVTWGGTTNAYPWIPDLNNRAKLWDWGSVCDWTGTTKTAGKDTTNQNVAWEITNCVQAAVSGRTNNGIMLAYRQAASATPGVLIHRDWDRVHANTTGRHPYVVVKYITKRYRKPFGSAEWAFVFGSDDAKYLSNASWDSVFALHGGHYTIFASERLLNQATYCTDAQLMALYARGNEIGNHSSRHVPASGTGGGLLHYHKTSLNGGGNLAAGAATTGWDSLMIDCSPAWMYAMAAAQGYGDLTGDIRFAKSHALPNGGWSPEIFEALYRSGYTAIRGTGAASTYDRYRYYEGGPSAPAAPIGKARADTIWTDGPITGSARWPRNLSLMAISASASLESGQSLFGPKSTPFSSASDIAKLKNNIKRAVFQCIGQNRRAVITFTHAIKNTPAAPAGYNDGVNANELDAALTMVDSLGGRYMGFAEYKTLIKAGATMIDTPAFATAPDTFAATAADRIWGKPNGIDNRWIPSVK